MNFPSIDGNPRSDIARRQHTPSNDGKFKPQQLRTPGSFEYPQLRASNRKPGRPQAEAT
jgi:hypothetical protein